MRRVLQTCLENNNANVPLDAVEVMVQRGTAQIWGDATNGAITCFNEVSGKRYLMLWMAWGKLKEIIKHHDDIRDFARCNGCENTATFTPRRAWARILGYKETKIWAEGEPFHV